MTHAATEAPTPPVCDLLLLNGRVLTLDDERRELDPGGVAIVGDRIAAVGPAELLSTWDARRVIDCRGSAVLPGLVDCHNHLFQGLTRTLGDGMALWPWLCELIWPYATHILEEDAEVAALLGAVEAARAGTTCIVDNHYAPAHPAATVAVARALERVGLRGVIARGIFGPYTEIARKRGLPETLFGLSAQEEIDITRDCMESFPRGGKVEVWPAPINPTYVDTDLLFDAVDLARRHDVGWHAHCSEVEIDSEVSLESYGLRPIEWLYREGLLAGAATIAHGIWLSEREIELLGETGTGVAHNPVANEYLASGVIRLRELRAAGAVVGLGTDGPAGAQRQDLFECMKAAVLLQRVSSLDPQAMFAEEALEIAAREGSRFARLDGGELAPGKLADVTIVDLDGPHVRPLHRTVTALVHSVRGSDVRMTIVGGDVVFEDGRCTFVDESAIIAEAQARAEALVARAGLEHLLVRWRSRPTDEGRA